MFIQVEVYGAIDGEKRSGFEIYFEICNKNLLNYFSQRRLLQLSLDNFYRLRRCINFLDCLLLQSIDNSDVFGHFI